MIRLASPPRLPLIAPSVLGADFSNLERECRSMIDAGAEVLHLDVMDGHFVPNLTMGPEVCRCLRRTFPNVYLDVHLMVTNPAMFVEPFEKAGANNLTFHVEVVEGEAIGALVGVIRGKGMQAGLAINPPTPVERILPHIGIPDLVLVMSVNPGFSGQAFITEVLAKTRLIRRQLSTSQRLEMDGGIGPANAAAVREAGCDLIVAASSLFGVPERRRRGVVEELRGGVVGSAI